MAETYKILAKNAPSNTNEHVLYSTSAGTEAILTNITVANRSTVNKTFDINIVDEPLTDEDLVGESGPASLTMYQDTDNYQDSSTLKYSTDQITWQTSTLPSASYWRTFAYLSDKFYAQKNPMMGSAGYATSTDLITWTESTAWGNVSGNTFVVGNNNYCFAPYYDLGMYTPTGLVYNSTDLVTWTSATIPPRTIGDQAIAQLAYGNGIYLGATAWLMDGYTSTDAITWTQWTGSANAVVADQNGYVHNASFFNGKFVIFGNDYSVGVSVLQTSTDCVTWIDETLPMVPNPMAALANSQVYLIWSDTSMAYSTDLITWDYTMPPASSLYKYMVSDDLFVLGTNGNGNSHYTSSNGATWTPLTNPDPARTMWNPAFVDGVISTPYQTNPVHSLYKNVAIPANTSKVLEPGIMLGSENSILIKGSSGLTFSGYGVELS